MVSLASLTPWAEENLGDPDRHNLFAAGVSARSLGVEGYTRQAWSIAESSSSENEFFCKASRFSSI